jgi:hypothetical protein
VRGAKWRKQSAGENRFHRLRKTAEDDDDDEDEKVGSWREVI